MLSGISRLTSLLLLYFTLGLITLESQLSCITCNCRPTIPFLLTTIVSMQSPRTLTQVHLPAAVVTLLGLQLSSLYRMEIPKSA
jgi:hypothetical protein